MKKIVLVFITINLILTNLYPKIIERVELENDFKKLELSTNEISERFIILYYFVKKTHPKNDKLKIASKNLIH